MLELSIISVLQFTAIAFVSRTVSHMLNYAFTYKQLLWKLKLLVALKIDRGLVLRHIIKVKRVSWGINIMEQLYDTLCNRSGGWAFLLRIMDCVFCTSMYVSLFFAGIAVLFFGVHFSALFFVPVLTFFMLEKI